MKKDIAELVAKCPNCQHVKVEHQKSRGLSWDIKYSYLEVGRFEYGLHCW